MSCQNLLLFVLFFTSVNLLGQQTTLIIPQTYEGALKNTKQLDVNLFAFPYEGSNIDVRDMKKKYPNLKVQDSITILPPNLSDFDEVSTLMSVVADTQSDSLALIIWLAGDYNTNDVTFFIDKNSSRSFKNAQKIQLKGGGKGKKVNVYPFGKIGRSPVEMFVKVPKNRGDELDELIKTRKYKNRITTEFGLGAFIGFGAGNMQHEYLSTETNFPGWYEVVLSEKIVGLSVAKYFRKFKIEARGTYQNIFQYTSYFRLRYGEREVFFSENGTRVINENVRVDTNRDRHTRHRLKLGLSAAPRFKLSKLMELQPYIGGGYILFFGDPYLANKFEGFLDPFQQPNTPFLDFGLNLETSVGYKQTLSIGFFYNIIDWQPVGYFEAIEGTNLNRSYRGYNFTVGYTFGL